MHGATIRFIGGNMFKIVVTSVEKFEGDGHPLHRSPRSPLLHNGERDDLYFSPNIFEEIKSGNMG